MERPVLWVSGFKQQKDTEPIGAESKVSLSGPWLCFKSPICRIAGQDPMAGNAL
jgi:hypothetical protein